MRAERLWVQGRLLGIKEQMLPVLAKEVIVLSEGCDPNVSQNASRIMAELAREEEKFASTLEAGEPQDASITSALLDAR
jgi:alanyl-tRNA synthetase